MRAGHFYESARMACAWALACFCIFDEEPVFDFSDWNLTQVALLVLGLFAITWENKLRAQWGGAWVYKDLVLLNATFFYVYSLERYVLAVIVIFCSHCLTPLESELVDNVEVFTANLQSCASLALGLLATGSVTCLYGTLGAAATALNRRWASKLSAGLVLAALTNAWATVGWDLAVNSLSMFSLDRARDLNMAHTPNALTYNQVAATADQFDWHKEQVRPFMMRFEALYLFNIQLVFFLTLSLSVWVWGLLLLDSLAGGQEKGSVAFWGLGLRSLAHTFATSAAFAAWNMAPLARALLHTPSEYWLGA